MNLSECFLIKMCLIKMFFSKSLILMVEFRWYTKIYCNFTSERFLDLSCVHILSCLVIVTIFCCGTNTKLPPKHFQWKKTVLLKTGPSTVYHSRQYLKTITLLIVPDKISLPENRGCDFNKTTWNNRFSSLCAFLPVISVSCPKLDLLTGLI